MTLDEHPVDRSTWGTPFDVDPGLHRLAAAGTGLKPFEERFTAAVGERRTVHVVLEKDPTAVVASPAAAPDAWSSAMVRGIHEEGGRTQAEIEAPRPPVASNVVFAEALGSGLLYTLNYERIVDRIHLGLRIGGSLYTEADSSNGRSGRLTLLSFPAIVSYYLGPATHKLQLGLGVTFLFSSNTSQDVLLHTGFAPTAVVGYRYLPRGSGISFGVAFTPLVLAKPFLPWGGVSAGYAF